MKTILSYIGGALVVVGIALSYIVNTAHAGDAISIKRLDRAILNEQQESNWIAALKSLEQKIDINLIYDYYFRNFLEDDPTGNYKDGDKVGFGKHKEIVTSSAYALLPFEAPAPISVDDKKDEVTYPKPFGPIKLTSQQQALHETFLQSVWSISINDLYDCICKKEGTEIICNSTQVVAISPMDYAKDKMAGKITNKIGNVP